MPLGFFNNGEWNAQFAFPSPSISRNISPHVEQKGANQTVFENLPEALQKKVSESYFCALGSSIMDNPVRFKDMPNSMESPSPRVDRVFVMQWLQNNPINPFTRAPVDPKTDLIPDVELEKQITKTLRTLKRTLEVTLTRPKVCGNLSLACDIFGIREGAAWKEIRSSYRALVRKLHPDSRSYDKNPKITFQILQWAYDVLKKTKKRQSNKHVREENTQFSSFFPQEPHLANASKKTRLIATSVLLYAMFTMLKKECGNTNNEMIAIVPRT